MAEIPGATYLGDGLYVTRDSWGQIELFAHNGLNKTDRVFLEPEVLARFVNYIDSLGVAK
ncbi:hypothetical protein SEA_NIEBRUSAYLOR_103 [Mycobacterium phage NiebruSaylor]|uniref:Uncharacterized protein n=4 Tax=Corndogvirus TaxID=1623285 RepID=A0A5P8DC66_BPMCO|nr:hypothetical protein PBI_CATDAWG_104 [Mycobacterium phage Catdawg]YP_010097597.1 hypothetical protein KNU03_gp107 [Mycobacterium phage Ryadel]AII28341.1 hypothetical protein PBI_YUNGJAMAL_102 [Mycobacterium phage YungJamal]AYQ98940.1 hypothetical protein SEA_VORRPS_103 [Mycobacterium phage Vorrps]QFP96593.1 hypothetical protein SEA_SMOOCH_102 [Mycobacterium phage Smooch]QGJ87421.1 hypothetical protein SEA_BLESSICA_101 [Mycobacterium phage Blessica]QOC59301.1 hypothetical protein SEA_NIEBRU